MALTQLFRHHKISGAQPKAVGKIISAWKHLKLSGKEQKEEGVHGRSSRSFLVSGCGNNCWSVGGTISVRSSRFLSTRYVDKSSEFIKRTTPAASKRDSAFATGRTAAGRRHAAEWTKSRAGHFDHRALRYRYIRFVCAGTPKN